MLKMSSSSEDDYVNNWIHSCDSCQAAACSVYCHTDSAYLCDDCDKRIHIDDCPVTHHRVLICAASETAPSVVTRSADAASLCIECDFQIHSANPLARRHIRVPVSPLGLTCPSTTSDHHDQLPPSTMFAPTMEPELEINEDETDSWLLLEPENTDNQTMSGFTYGEQQQLDEYIDSCTEPYGKERCAGQQQQLHVHGVNYPQDCGNDSVVPVQLEEEKILQKQSICFNSDHSRSKAAFTNYPSSSSNLRVPMVLISAGIPNSCTRYHPTTKEMFPNLLVLMPLQFTSMNREEKVLRYRERRKARRFEKKIRYSSRKAYAETRPRIKGRFARKTNMGIDDDQMFSKEDYGYGYGVVPSL